jgi:hypothetical protein
MIHTVTWTTAMKPVTAPDLTQMMVWIETAAGVVVDEAYVPAGTTQAEFPLEPGDYVEYVAATNATGTVQEGVISRPFTIPNPDVILFPLPAWPPDPTVPPYDKTTWDAHMIEYGIQHGDYLSTTPSIDEKINHIYYDMCRVMYQIADYTETPEPWNGYAKQAMRWYRDEYVLPNNGAVPGYENFTHGLRMDFERTGDAASKAAAISLSQNAMYAGDWTDPSYVLSYARSREVAYAIFSYINAEKLGEAKREIRARYVTQSYDYCRQWQDEAHWADGEITPFMMAITAQALIEDWEETHDARCLPTLRALADWVWPKAYDAPNHALFYQINPGGPGGVSPEGADDLNMLIAPWYAWLWVQTGDAKYRDQFDELLLGQAGAYLERGKQWDQNYWWAFAGMAWRDTGPNI